VSCLPNPIIGEATKRGGAATGRAKPQRELGAHSWGSCTTGKRENGGRCGQLFVVAENIADETGRVS